MSIGNALVSGFSQSETAPFGGLDGRVKILAAVAWALLAAALSHLAPALAALGGSIILAALARLSPVALLRRLATVNAFIAFMWLMVPFSFSSPGQTVATLGPLAVTLEGLTLAALLTVKANAIVIAVIAILSTSPLFVLAAAGRALGLPEKLVSLFLLTVRYFHVMFDEYQRLRTAMRARGFSAGLNGRSLKGVADLVGSLLVRSFDRAERVHKAMLCRGYTGAVHVRAEFSIRGAEAAFIALMAAMLIAVGSYQWLMI